jgi:hypothetical protein
MPTRRSSLLVFFGVGNPASYDMSQDTSYVEENCRKSIVIAGNCLKARARKEKRSERMKKREDLWSTQVNRQALVRAEQPSDFERHQISSLPSSVFRSVKPVLFEPISLSEQHGPRK